ncbi:MAG: hypothetical protein KBD51_00520 [Candidatus Levybacteria bacterium]|nr:hypothetical protein [Candidatus Levybacteria bacterium]
MKLNRRRDYVFLILAVALIAIFVILAIVVTFGEIGSGPKKSIQPSGESETAPRVKYESGSLGKSLIKLTSRTPLSPADQSAKERLISISEGNSGLISESTNYSIEYIRAMDDIEVEILTTDIDLAKTEATIFLKNQGLSDQGLCNLPVRFYLSYVVTKEIPSTMTFNPLPPGC